MCYCRNGRPKGLPWAGRVLSREAQSSAQRSGQRQQSFRQQGRALVASRAFLFRQLLAVAAAAGPGYGQQAGQGDFFAAVHAQAAAAVEPLEQVVDLLKEQLRTRHILRMREGKCSIEAGFVWADLLTDLERTSDHCSNIAVAMIELESDAFDTHEYLKSVKDMKSDSFARYYEEYSKKFAL